MTIAPAIPEHSAAPPGPPVGDLARRRICVLSEDLSGAPDEGTKKLALSLSRALGQRHDVTVVSTEGRASLPGARLVPAPRSFLSARLSRELARAAPELLIYV